MLAKKLQEAAGNGADAKLYVDDVFSTYTYTGANSTQTINNGIDLAGKGGLVWIKSRNNFEYNSLTDTERGVNTVIRTDVPAAQVTPGYQNVTSFNSNGFTCIPTGYGSISAVFWTFRKAPKFFDVVTYTGNGNDGRRITHALGVAPGMIIVKCTSSETDWYVYHRSSGAANKGVLNSTIAFSGSYNAWSATPPTFNDFTVGTNGSVNDAGKNYVAYLYAHDPSADGLIQCGSFNSNSAGTVNLGWEPQYLLKKRTDGTDDWQILDVTRGWSNTGVRNLVANASYAEWEGTAGATIPTATGFSYGVSGGDYIYMAIRRSDKPPTSGTQVYNAIARTGTGAAATVTGVGFAPDFVICLARLYATGGVFCDRLRGQNRSLLFQGRSDAERVDTNELLSYDIDGISLGTSGTNSYLNSSGVGGYINYFFKRAPGFFDVVCYTGTDSNQAVAHNLGVIPELIFAKSRNGGGDWCGVRRNGGSIAFGMSISSSSALQYGASFPFAPSDISLTATSMNPQFFESSAGTTRANASGGTYVAYLFATLNGISKVGTYTGNGSSQTINCGFAAGARFILIKRTDAAGDWYVWDTVRGIVSANDPHLSLNTTAAEVTTDDSVEPYSAGFAVNQVAATNINVASATYIFLAIA
jgi:hypothetical protein